MAQSGSFPDNGFPYQFPDANMSVPEDAKPVETGNPFDPAMTPTVSAANEPWTEKYAGTEDSESPAEDLFEMP